MTEPGTITRSEAIKQVSAQMEGPVSFNDFVNRVLAIWPSRAKNPKSGIRQAVKNEHLGKELLFLDETTLLPMHLAMRGVQFRIPLSRQEVERGWLFVYPSFQFMVNPELLPEDFWLEENNGQKIPVNLVTHRIKENTIFGPQEYEKVAFDLGQWYQKHKVQRKDSLVATILDWEAGRFQLQPESAREYHKHRTEILEQNQALADILFNALENARGEYIWGRAAIPTAYLRLKDRRTYPADHWLEIVDQDPRILWDGYEIHYADWRSPLDTFLTDQDPQPPIKPKPLSGTQARQVYRFKAYLWYRKGLWRRIEIQGRQTLAEFDKILRDAFQHDFFDHLSGFWKLVRRGESRRFREVDLGSIYPYQGGEAAEIRIADIGLNPGEALKYVYDFGDWIEHRIELEARDVPEPEQEYPRIVAQNKPRYKYCEVCKSKGKKTVATWICITCSNREQREVLFCEACLDSHAEDHYEEEMIY